ncbi:hypothetical protein VE02_01329 [Pseudogymnoascus sp. 03VT05]|nr:hypothetical protein VE00_04428 [Pseudogymnoascus sp. WSF 3629]OBT89716.1 hypothetical protein VE02_01329 [Pseudogymnoascus sp. 03VT05]
MPQSSLREVWEGAVGNQFAPSISKDSQFSLGFSLLALGILLSGYFGLNRSVTNLPLVGVPAALAIGFGAVYMICAVGVYV